MSEHPPSESKPDRSGSAAARGAWVASGITFFAVGVVFTLTMPDDIALGITFLGLGVVFFSLAGSNRAPGDGPGVAKDAGEVPAAPLSPADASSPSPAPASPPAPSPPSAAPDPSLPSAAPAPSPAVPSSPPSHPAPESPPG